MNTNTDVKAGMVVLTESGRFVHYAKDQWSTICGKSIRVAYPRQDTSVDCRVCNPRRHTWRD